MRTHTEPAAAAGRLRATLTLRKLLTKTTRENLRIVQSNLIIKMIMRLSLQELFSSFLVLSLTGKSSAESLIFDCFNEIASKRKASERSKKIICQLFPNCNPVITTIRLLLVVIAKKSHRNIVHACNIHVHVLQLNNIVHVHVRLL